MLGIGGREQVVLRKDGLTDTMPKIICALADDNEFDQYCESVLGHLPLDLLLLEFSKLGLLCRVNLLLMGLSRRMTQSRL